MAQDTQTKKKGIHYAWFILLAIIIMMGFMRGGLNSALGQFLYPVSQSLDVNLTSMSLMFTVSAFVGMIWNPIAGQLLAKHGIRVVAAISVAVHALSFAAMGLMGSVFGFYSLSAVMALGAAFTTQMIGPVLINRWFKEKNGLAMGIMMSGVGLFGAVLQPVTAGIITKFGWSAAYLSLGLISCAIVLPVTLLLYRNAPEDKGLKAYGAAEGADAPAAAAAAKAAPVALPGITCKRALKSPAFYCLFIFMMFLCGACSFNPHIGPLAIESGFTTQVGGNAMACWMIGTMIGSLIIGSLADKLGAQKTAILAMCCGIVAVLILATMRTNLIAFYGSFLIYGLLASSMGTMAPLLTSSLFGYKEFSQIFGYILAAINVASMVLVPLYGLILDTFQSYQNALYMILAFFVVNILCIVIAFNSGKKLKAEF